FFDLEMSRVGTEAMQLGSLWNFFVVHNHWHTFTQGYADQGGRPLTSEDIDAAKAFAHFLVWRYISRNGQWHGEPNTTAHHSSLQEEATQYERTLANNLKVA